MLQFFASRGCDRASRVRSVQHIQGTREFAWRVSPEQFQVTLGLTAEVPELAAAADLGGAAQLE